MSRKRRRQKVYYFDGDEVSLGLPEYADGKRVYKWKAVGRHVDSNDIKNSWIPIFYNWKRSPTSITGIIWRAYKRFKRRMKKK